jgi:hypothetical protein
MSQAELACLLNYDATEAVADENDRSALAVVLAGSIPGLSVSYAIV